MLQNGFCSPPQILPEPKDCQFYHVIDIPGVGLVGNGWDLRKTIDAYLGNCVFTDKDVLDVGAAGGYLTFEMEKRGARVVSFDMQSGEQWNVVPFVNSRFDMEDRRKVSILGHRRLENAYWLAQERLRSKARRFVGDVYDFPKSIGLFDVVVLGMILPHLRDPFQALASAAALSKDTIIVTQQSYHSNEPTMKFMPDPKNNQPDRAWWLMSDNLVERWLNVLGFHLLNTVTEQHYSVARKQKVPCTAFVGKRKS